MHEPARQRARDLANTPAFASGQRERKKWRRFAELKNVIGLHRLRLRRMKFVREQFFLAAAAQNVKGSDLGVDPNAAMTPPGSEDDVGSWLRHNQVNIANGGGR